MKTVLSSLFRWFQKQSSTRQSLLAIFGLFSGLLLLSWAGRMVNHSQKPTGATVPSPLVARRQEIDTERKSQSDRVRDASKLTAPVDYISGDMAAPAAETGRAVAPLMAYAADLGVTTKEFARSRTSLEEILDRHHAYATKLRMVGQLGASTLTATLRVPSSEFATTVNDLKALGVVEREEQTADEITQRRADLEARLTNAQHAAARLQGILMKSGKVTDLAAVQRELAGLTGEIARLEAEQLTEDHRVTFAQVLFSLREEIPPPVESLGTQFRNAALSGLSNLMNSVSAVALFVISEGPVLLLWAAFLYFPTLWIWKKCRPTTKTREAMAQGG